MTVFEKLVSDILGPLEREYCFAKPRMWRFDYAWLGPKIALEVEGGAFKGKPCPVCGIRGGGRHNRGKSFIDEMAKYNTAACLGWRIIRCTPEQRDSGDILKTLERLV